MAPPAAAGVDAPSNDAAADEGAVTVAGDGSGSSGIDRGESSTSAGGGEPSAPAAPTSEPAEACEPVSSTSAAPTTAEGAPAAAADVERSRQPAPSSTDAVPHPRDGSRQSLVSEKLPSVPPESMEPQSTAPTEGHSNKTDRGPAPVALKPTSAEEGNAALSEQTHPRYQPGLHNDLKYPEQEILRHPQEQLPPPPPPLPPSQSPPIQQSQNPQQQQGPVQGQWQTPPTDSSQIPAHAAELAAGHVLKKKGRFTFVEASPAPTEGSRKAATTTTTSSDGSAYANEVRKGRFTVSMQDRVSSETSTASQVSHGSSNNITPTGTPEGTPGPPLVTKKGRFVITNANPNPAATTTVPMQTVVTQNIQPGSSMQNESHSQSQAHAYEQPPAYGHSSTSRQSAHHGEMPYPAPPLPHPTMPMPSHGDASVQQPLGSYDPRSAPPQLPLSRNTTPSSTPPPPPPPPFPPNETHYVPLQMVATMSYSPATSIDQEHKAPLPYDPQQDPQMQHYHHHQQQQQQQQHQQQQPRKVAPRSNIPRNSATGYVGREGLGKVFYFLDQMRLEVSEADRLIKSFQTDNKCLKDKNKELEAKLRESERKLKEEKSLRESAEAKVKALRKKLRGNKEDNEQDAPGKEEVSVSSSMVHRRPSKDGKQPASQSDTRALDTIFDSGGTDAESIESKVRTPTKAVATSFAAAKSSPENRIGGTPPRDPNSQLLSGSPVASQTKLPIMNNVSGASESSTASLPNSPSSAGITPEKRSFQHSGMPRLPGLGSHAPGATYGGPGSPRSFQPSHGTVSAGPYAFKHSVSDLSNMISTASEPTQFTEKDQRTAANSHKPAVSAFDPLRQAGLETIEGLPHVGGPSTRTSPVPPLSSSTGVAFIGQSSAQLMGLQDPNGQVYNLQQPTLPEPQSVPQQPGMQAQDQSIDDFHPFQSAGPAAAPHPLQPQPLAPARASSWDASQWSPSGAAMGGGGGSHHAHSVSHDSMLAPSPAAVVETAAAVAAAPPAAPAPAAAAATAPAAAAAAAAAAAPAPLLRPPPRADSGSSSSDPFR